MRAEELHSLCDGRNPRFNFPSASRCFTGHHRLRLGVNMSWFQLPLREQLLVGAAMALTFAVFYVAGLQVGGHW